MSISGEEGAMYTVGGVGVLAAFFKLWKMAMQTMRADKMESTAMMSDMTSYNRLLDEIKRLETIIELQHSRIEKMENKFQEVRDVQLEDVADIASMNILLRGFPCGQCKNPTDIFGQARDILRNLVDRRKSDKPVTNKIEIVESYSGAERRKKSIPVYEEKRCVTSTL